MIVEFILLAGQLGVAALAQRPTATESPTQASSTITGPLTLSAAVAQARTGSPRRQAAAVVADAAREAAQSAGKLPNPFFELRTENWSTASPATSPSLDVFAVVMQPFELGDKRGIRQRLAASESDVARTALDSLERELALETVRAYIRGLKARALVDTLTSNRDGLAMLIASVERQVDEGYTAEADLLKFKTEAARVDGEIARARLELERSLAALAIVIGRATPIQPSELVEPPPLPIPSADTQTIAASIARHPDVLAASATVNRATQIAAFERAKRLPDPMITGGYKRTAGFNTMVLGVSFAMPLFDRNRVSLATSAGLERGSIAARDALVHRLNTDAASSARAAQTIATQASKASLELLAPAEEVRRAARAAFREGTADVLKLIDAERVYADVHRTAIELRLDALLATIEARFALGQEAIP